MGCEMELESECIEDMEIEVLPSMWPEDIGTDAGKQFNIEKPGGDQDMLEEVTIMEEPTIADFQRLMELTNYTDKGSSQLAYLMKHWEYKQANAVRLLREELDILSKQRQEVEQRRLELLQENRFEEDYGGDKRPVSILDEVYYTWQDLPSRKSDVVVQNKRIEIEAEYDTVVYWKQRAMQLEKQLEASVQREQTLMDKLQESIETIERQSSPVEELSQILKRADNFLHFILQNAPVVIGHQDKELRYRFIYNHYPRLQEEDIIGKTDVEIFTGSGVKESQDFKREVMEKGLPAKKEITFETDLFGSKTFLIYVEPVFSKAGETIGINYMGMEITDQVRKRERMAKLREEIAVQKAKETELNKTIHITASDARKVHFVASLLTEETMRAKQMLATMSHEIRSPLSGVVSMAEILSTTKLDREQRQLLDVMISSGDLVLQLINDILDLSKVESG
ncbi:Histidine kinase 5 [Stylosanthes scabra]|uniref:histidine kinase n=1 Tax=Stylosanthes scabra TaxID=79078 RepID=A0ABU6SBY8_9FABA|nr:Histidine kinase 5 [Stylosanthes scabra]